MCVRVAGICGVFERSSGERASCCGEAGRHEGTLISEWLTSAKGREGELKNRKKIKVRTYMYTLHAKYICICTCCRGKYNFTRKNVHKIYMYMYSTFTPTGKLVRFFAQTLGINALCCFHCYMAKFE